MDAEARESLLAEGLASLFRLPLTTPEPELLTLAINLAEAATNSQIGYVHYVNDDQQTIELAVWSTTTIAQCQVVSDRHYPIATAGVWADTFRTRAPSMHNDYPSAPHRRGLPEGHADLVRHLGVPVIEGDMVRLLVGVGNKVEPYDDHDIETLQRVANDTWLPISRLREVHHATSTLDLLRSQSGALRLCTWEWDPATDRVGWGKSAEVVLGATASTPGFTSWRPLLEALDTDSRAAFHAALRDAEPNEGLDLPLTGLVHGFEARTYRLTGGWATRPTGHGVLMQGVLIDTSTLTELDAAKQAAERDALTGLPNRSGLITRLTHRLTARRLRTQDEFAVLFIDLDRFKIVNDSLGHLAGDVVLRECATRLVKCVRAQDVAARFGGDEFVVIQSGGPNEAEIEALAATIIDALSAPISTAKGPISVGASIGAVLSRDTLPGIETMLRRADEALYLAKSQGGGLVIAGRDPDATTN